MEHKDMLLSMAIPLELYEQLCRLAAKEGEPVTAYARSLLVLGVAQAAQVEHHLEACEIGNHGVHERWWEELPAPDEMAFVRKLEPGKLPITVELVRWPS